jgi:hypothetical protein
MKKKEFKGKLEKISPNLLIDENDRDQFHNFFLILGMIFNDLKGLIFLQHTVVEDYRKPADDETSVHLGEYAGLITQANKFLIATIAEFYIFIKKTKKFLVILDINY